MIKGYVAIVLHAHLPYIHHPDRENTLEEKWLFEAISETYLPLLSYFEDLEKDKMDYRITMSISPPLMSMLTSDLLQYRYVEYLRRQIELCKKEIDRTKNMPEFNKLAKMYYSKYTNCLESFTEKYKGNILTGFVNAQNNGKIEFIACAATHGYLPLLSVTPEAVKAQISIGVNSCYRHLGRHPKGIWLPECGYSPDLEIFLKENDIDYFIMEANGLLHADPRPVFGTFAPIVTPNGLVAFSRDLESSRQVWSSKDGFPGDYDYREYYRDIGYDLDYEYIKDYISPDGARSNTGIKYYRITGDTDKKLPYDPDKAAAKANIHAGSFMFSREKQIERLYEYMGRPPLIVCPYDAELFGHWWYEGPYWLYCLMKKIHLYQDIFKLTTLGEYLQENPVMQVSRPSASSWGINGYNEMWLNSSNDWIYRHLHRAAERMVELANQYKFENGLKRRALNQAARELLLAQSSDWPFIIKTGTMVQYAEKRIHEHIGRFLKLYHDIKEDAIDENWLEKLEHIDNIFPEIDYHIYADK